MKRKRPAKNRYKAISVESGHLEGTWPGHFPVTSVALVSLLDRVAEGEASFSAAERILFVACEFWSAFNSGELDSHFDLKAEDPTRHSRMALRIVGAVQFAKSLERGVLGPPGGRANIPRRRRLAILEEKLRRINEPVDLLIARFAWHYLATHRPKTRAPALQSPPTGPLAIPGPWVQR
jgi:hypothetical protein